MVNPKIFKNIIKSKISQEYKLEFLGENFDKIVKKISETKAERIYNWINRTIEKKIQPILIGSKKKYKDWEIYKLLTFRYPFKVDNVDYMVLFIKVKNSFYIEFHLGDHKYYDKIRKDLNLTKKNY